MLAMVLVLGVLVAPCAVPGSSGDPLSVEADARTVPWSTFRRLALEAGVWSPAYRPISEQELATLLDAALQTMQSRTATPARRRETARLRWWLDRYRNGTRGWNWNADRHATRLPRLRIGARARTGYTDFGSPFEQEAGLSWARGYNASIEPALDVVAGRWWFSTTTRFTGNVFPAGTDFTRRDGQTSPLTWPDWDVATGRRQVRDARLQGDRWLIEFPRVVAGASFGDWSATAGWAPRRVGPGVDRAVALDQTAPSFPAVTLRRTRPFHIGRSFPGFLAPDELLLRTGRLSDRQVQYRDPDGVLHQKTAPPWFFQWLVGWRPMSWFRGTFTHVAMATAREGDSLWGDLLQISFPTLDTTKNEEDAGPLTDRIFSLQLELNWHDVPLPLLPSAGGRAYWDYGGEDFARGRPNGLVPGLAVTASVLGIELVDPAWDLGVEYAEYKHPRVLWYSNSAFPEGYSQDRWVLGDALGGSGEAFTVLTRVRPAGRDLESAVKIRFANWGGIDLVPGTGHQKTVALSLKTLAPVTRGAGSLVPPFRELTVEWNREEVEPRLAPGQREDWWRIYLTAGF